MSFFDVDGMLVDQPLELGRLTGRAVRYAAVHAYALVEPDGGRAIGSATWGNAILTRRPLTAGFAAGLPVGLDDEPVDPADSGLPLAGVTYDAAPYGVREPRCVVGGQLADASGDIQVVATHLAYAGAGQRRAQAAFLARLAAESAGPLVLLGDLNAAIDAPELAPLSGSLDDAFATAGVPVGDARRASCGPQAIDHVLTRALAVEGCFVVRSAGDASDHLPVVATLRQAPASRSSIRAT